MTNTLMDFIKELQNDIAKKQEIMNNLINSEIPFNTSINDIEEALEFVNQCKQLSNKDKEIILNEIKEISNEK
jgi:uncharacterized protein YoxC